MCKIQEPQFSYENKTYLNCLQTNSNKKRHFKDENSAKCSFLLKSEKKVKTLLFIIASFIYQLLCAMVPSV